MNAKVAFPGAVLGALALLLVLDWLFAGPLRAALLMEPPGLGSLVAPVLAAAVSARLAALLFGLTRGGGLAVAVGYLVVAGSALFGAWASAPGVGALTPRYALLNWAWTLGFGVVFGAFAALFLSVQLRAPQSSRWVMALPAATGIALMLVGLLAGLQPTTRAPGATVTRVLPMEYVASGQRR